MRLITTGIYLLALGFLAACQGKTCQQNAEVKVSFTNLTDVAQTFSLDVYANGQTRAKVIELGPYEVSRLVLLDTYAYQKEPRYHGKVDFSPKKAECSGTEIHYAAMQFSDAELSSIKLCFKNAILNQPEEVFVVATSSPCPSGTFALRRW